MFLVLFSTDLPYSLGSLDLLSFFPPSLVLICLPNSFLSYDYPWSNVHLSGILTTRQLSSGRALVLYLLGCLLGRLSTSTSHLLPLWPTVTISSQHLLSHLNMILGSTRLLSWFVTMVSNIISSSRIQKTIKSGKCQDNLSKCFRCKPQKTKLNSFCLTYVLKFHWGLLCSLVKQSVLDHSYHI